MKEEEDVDLGADTGTDCEFVLSNLFCRTIRITNEEEVCNCGSGGVVLTSLIKWFGK